MDLDGGRYRIIRRAGSGGTGVVYQAADTLLGRSVAIKALLPSMGRELLHGEGRSLARLDHPNVVAIHDLIEDRGRPYLVMEYVEGCTLQHWLDEHGPMRVDQALNIVRQIGGALVAAHASGMLHCDLKPSNVMLSDGGTAKLTDFTLARHRLGERYHGVSGSSPQFAAPEQIEGEEIDARADVYSLGKLLDAAIGPQMRTRRDRQTHEAVERATAAEPASRYAFIEEMLAALPVPARDVTRVAARSRLSDLTRVAPVQAVPKLPMPTRRRVWGIAALPAAGLLAAAGLVGHFQASASPETVTLPGLTGTQGSSARTVTRSLQLQPYVVPRYSATVHRGYVISQQPVAGAHVTRNSAVMIVVSRGPRPIEVPSLDGLSQEDAVKRLKNLGFHVTITTSDTVWHDPGEVLGQNPAPRTMKLPGTRVILTISSRPWYWPF